MLGSIITVLFIIGFVIGVLGLLVSGVRGVFRIPDPPKYSTAEDLVEDFDEEAFNAAWDKEHLNLTKEED